MVAAKGSVRIWWDNDVEAYRCSTPYHAEFVKQLTALIPFAQRSWDPQAKIWTVTEQAMPVIQQLAEKAFNVAATVITKQQAQAASSASAITKKDINEVIVDFVKLVPRDAMRRAYLQASTLLHPDHGGDMDKMSRMNAAWTRIEKEVYGKE